MSDNANTFNINTSMVNTSDAPTKSMIMGNIPPPPSSGTQTSGVLSAAVASSLDRDYRNASENPSSGVNTTPSGFSTLVPQSLGFGAFAAGGIAGAGPSIPVRQITPEEARRVLEGVGYMISPPAIPTSSFCQNATLSMPEESRSMPYFNPVASMFTGYQAAAMAPPAFSTVTTATPATNVGPLGINPEMAKQLLLDLLVKAAPASLASTLTPPDVAQNMLDNWYATMSGEKPVKRFEVFFASTPFVREIYESNLPMALVTPLSLSTYDGTTDPDDYMQDFEHHRTVGLWNNATACLMFPGHLRVG